jgi:hypothetical protein
MFARYLRSSICVSGLISDAPIKPLAKLRKFHEYSDHFDLNFDPLILESVREFILQHFVTGGLGLSDRASRVPEKIGSSSFQNCKMLNSAAWLL